MLKKMGSQSSYPLSLEIGCGAGVGAEVIVEQFGANKVIAVDIKGSAFRITHVR